MSESRGEEARQGEERQTHYAPWSELEPPPWGLAHHLSTQHNCGPLACLLFFHLSLEFLWPQKYGLPELDRSLKVVQCKEKSHAKKGKAKTKMSAHAYDHVYARIKT